MIVGILLSALAIRVGAAWTWQQRLGQSHLLSLPDSHSYWHLADRLATGNRYEYGGPDFSVFRTPGYPLLLAGVKRFVGGNSPVMAARIVGAVLGTVAVAGVIWLGTLVFDGPTGLVAGGLAAVYPGAIAMSILVLAESLFCPFLVGQLACWVSATRATRRVGQIGWAVSAGLLAGGATLARPSWLLFTPLVIVGSSVWPRRGSRSEPGGRRTMMGGWVMLGLVIAMMPWWVRNYRVTGHFVPTTLQVGASLYDGLHEGATGASSMEFSQSFYDAQKLEDLRLGRSADGFEVRLDRRYRRAAWDWATDHPGDVVRLAAVKFTRMWNLWPNAAEFRSGVIRWLVAAGFVPIFAAMLVGGWKWGRRGWPYLLILLPAGYFTMLHIVFVSSIRYRQPTVLVGTVLAAAALVAGWSHIVRWKGATGRIASARREDDRPA